MRAFGYFHRVMKVTPKNFDILRAPIVSKIKNITITTKQK